MLRVYPVGSNDAAFNTALTAGGVTYASLLSTIFSGQVTPYTNGSTTGVYLNLGGFKIVLAHAPVSITATSTATPYAVNFPSSFLSTIYEGFQTTFMGDSDSLWGAGTYEALSTGSMNGYIANAATTGTASVHVLAIGT